VKFFQLPAALKDDGKNFLGGRNIIAGGQLLAQGVKLEMICNCPQRTELHKSAAQNDSPYLSSRG
jgi:hypothetical protein